MKKQFRLPKEFAEKWLAALRSGEYKQGPENLVEYNEEEDKETCTHCCLGVAAEICGISREVLNQQPLLELEWLDAKHLVKVPSEIQGDNDVNILVGVLTRFNDGLRRSCYNSKSNNLKPSTYNFRHVDMHKYFEQEDAENFQLSFEQIADFIEDNCEFYEEVKIQKEEV